MARDKRQPIIRRRDDDEAVPWHKGKGPTLAILFQAACFVWYAAQSAYELKDHDAKLTEFAVWRKSEDESRGKIESHLEVEDEKLLEQSNLLNKMDDHLEKILIRK